MLSTSTAPAQPQQSDSPDHPIPFGSPRFGFGSPRTGSGFGSKPVTIAPVRVPHIPPPKKTDVQVLATELSRTDRELGQHARLERESVNRESELRDQFEANARRLRAELTEAQRLKSAALETLSAVDPSFTPGQVTALTTALAGGSGGALLAARTVVSNTSSVANASSAVSAATRNRLSERTEIAARERDCLSLSLENQILTRVIRERTAHQPTPAVIHRFSPTKPFFAAAESSALPPMPADPPQPAVFAPPPEPTVLEGDESAKVAETPTDSRGAFSAAFASAHPKRRPPDRRLDRPSQLVARFARALVTARPDRAVPQTLYRFLLLLLNLSPCLHLNRTHNSSRFFCFFVFCDFFPPVTPIHSLSVAIALMKIFSGSSSFVFLF